MASKTDLSKLYRSETNRVIAGVCGGLGEYFNIDPTILRIIIIFITLFGGSGIILYIILWIVIPTKSTLGKNSDDYIKANVEEIKEKSKTVTGRDTHFILGLILVVLGLTFLLENLGFYTFRYIWRLWPIFLIILGLSVLIKKK